MREITSTGRDNIGLLVDAIDQRVRPWLPPADDVLDDVERMIASQATSAAEHCRLELTAHHLSQIEFAVLRLAQASTGDGTGQ